MTGNQEKTSLAPLFAKATSKSGAIECSGLSGSAKAWLVARLYAQVRRSMCVVTATLKEAERMAGAVDFFLGHRSALHTSPPPPPL